jgi:ATP-dependent exoDNAse (exonuclease V) beta subunit
MSDHPGANRRMTRIIANAGSGKTYALSTRYIAIIAAMLRRESSCAAFDPASVLATTFTRAAAGEIRDRILTRLAQAALDKDKRKILHDDVCKVDPSLTGAFDPARILARLTNQFDRLEIRTIDSVFTRLAQAFGQEVGLPLPLQFLSEAETTAASRRALRQVMNESTDVDAISKRLQKLAYGVAASSLERVIGKKLDHGLSALRDSQLPGALATDIPPAWDAPPGKTSGKLLSDEQLGQVVDALRREVRAMIKPRDGYKKMLAKLDSPPSVLKGKGNTWQEWVKGVPAVVLNDPHNPLYYNKPVPAGCAAQIQILLDHITALQDVTVAAQAQAWAQFLLLIDDAWKRIMAQDEKVTFESVTRQLSLAMNHASIPEIAFRLDARIDHLLLDEFQDTSVGQWQALRPLAQEIASTDNADRVRSLLVVGDPKQSIYGWRAGEPRLLCDFKNMIHDGRSELDVHDTETLNTSYRSSPVILQFVDHLFLRLQKSDDCFLARNRDDYSKRFLAAITKWAAQYIAHQSAEKCKNLAGCVQVRMLPAVTGVSSAAVDQRLISESASIAIAQFRRFKGNASVAIIARRNKDVAKLVECIRNHPQTVACVALAGGDMQTSPAVVAFLDALRFSSHPGDTISLFGVATTPLAQVLGLKQEWACNHEDKTIAQERMRHRERAARNIREQLAQMGVAGAFAQWHHQIMQSPTPLFDQSDQQRIARLIQETTRLEAQGTRTVAELVDSLAAVRVQDARANAIHVINIHQAKGLEWDAVIYHAGADKLESTRPTFAVNREQALQPPTCVVPWISGDIIPKRYQSTMDFANEFRMQEQLSQLYVALTRAKQGLWIVGSCKKKGIGATPAGIVCDAICSMPGMRQPELADAQSDAANTSEPSCDQVDASDDADNAVDADVDQSAIAKPAAFQMMTIGDELWAATHSHASDMQETATEIVDVSMPEARGVKIRALSSPSSTHESFATSAGANAKHQTSAIDRGALLATERGTIAHLVAESIQWSDNWSPDAPGFIGDLVAKARAQFPQRHESAIEKVVRDTIAQLNSPEIKSMLAKPAPHAAIFCERKFVRVFENGGVQEGIIDRVELIAAANQTIQDGASGQSDQSIKWSAARIIDFKTDSFNASTQTLDQWKQDRAQYHASQLSAYAQVIAREHSIALENISLHLVLLHANTTAQAQLLPTSND